MLREKSWRTLFAVTIQELSNTVLFCLLTGGHTRQRIAEWIGSGARHGAHDPTIHGGSEGLRPIKIPADERRPAKQLRGDYTSGMILTLNKHKYCRMF